MHPTYPTKYAYEEPNTGPVSAPAGEEEEMQEIRGGDVEGAGDEPDARLEVHKLEDARHAIAAQVEFESKV